MTSPGDQRLPALAKAGLLFPGLVEPPTSAQQRRLQRNSVLQFYTPEESVIYTSLFEVQVRWCCPDTIRTSTATGAMALHPMDVLLRFIGSIHMERSITSTS